MKNTDMRNILKRYWAEVILCVLFITTLAYNMIWLGANKLPPSWDPSAHLMLSLAYYNVLTHPAFDMIGRLVSISNYYPPFYHISTAVMYIFFGKSMNTAILTNTVFYGILLFSIYGLGKKLFNKETGVFAAVLITLYPSIFSLQRVYMLEIPLTALVALSIYLLVLSEKFKNLKYAAVFGAVSAFTILAKWTGLLFIIGPFLLTVHDTYSNVTLGKKIEGLFKKNAPSCAQCGNPLGKGRLDYSGRTFCSNICKNIWKKGRKINSGRTASTINLVLALGVFLFISLIWYIPHLNDMYYNVILGQTTAGAMEGDPDILSLPSILYYPLSILDYQVFGVFFIVMMLGVIHIAKERKPNILLFLSWIVIPYIAFTLFRNKDPRTFLPVITVFALVSAFYLSGIKNSRIKTYAVAALLIFGTAQLFTMAAGIDSIASATKLNIISPDGIRLFPDPGSGGPPSRDDWKSEDVIKEILSDNINNPRTVGRYAVVIVIPDHGLLNGYTLDYFAIRDNLPLNIINAAYLQDTSTFMDNFLRFDYIVSKDGEYWSSTYKDKVITMNEYFESHKSEGYILIKQYPLPDGSNVSVYKNIK
ncbi:MAG: glycosyltransferase family 39 protein [Candidatus Methanoperedens sp.]